MRLLVEERLGNVGFVSARSVEVVVKRRVWGALNACPRAILWRQGRHTDPNEGSWNNVRFIVAALWHESSCHLCPEVRDYQRLLA